MRHKKIYFEAGALVADHFSGVGHYVQGIAQAWDQYLAQPDHTVLQDKHHTRFTTTICASKYRVSRFSKFRLNNMRTKGFPLPSRLLHKFVDQGLLPPLDIWFGRGTYFFTNFVSYPLLKVPSATVVYDLSFEVVPQFADANNRRYLSKMVRKAVYKSNLVVTISNHTKRQLVDFYNISPKKVLVAYPAVDKALFYHRSDWEIAKVKHEYELPNNYVLFVGNIEPRKNISTLIDAYIQLPHKYSKHFPLLLVGTNGWLSEDIFNKLESARSAGYTIVRPKTYVEDIDMPALYSGAAMMVYPSHYEGFGMPPLEAMSCGVPVITSDNSSLPEVVGRAGLLVKSTDTKGLSQTMLKLMSDDSLRASLTEKGYSQSQKFSWDTSAQKIYKALLEL